MCEWKEKRKKGDIIWLGPESNDLTRCHSSYFHKTIHRWRNLLATYKLKTVYMSGVDIMKSQSVVI